MMVVGIHTWPAQNGYQLDGSFMEVLQLLMKNFFNCAVPLFLAISGYFIGRKNLVSFAECRTFWRKQIPTVYIPCLIFSIPWFVISCMSVNIFFEGRVIFKLLNLFFCGYSVYYFIALIIECYVLTPILLKYNNIKGLIVVVIISCATSMLQEYVRFYGGIDLPLIVYGSFPPVLIFYFLGIYFSRRLRSYSLWLPATLIAVGFVCGILHMQFLRSNLGIQGDGQKLSLYLFDAGIILLCLSERVEKWYRDNRFTRVVLYVGVISFGIYFTHVYLIFIISRLAPQLRNSWLLMWLLSILLTIAFIAGVKRVIPVYARRYLGYR